MREILVINPVRRRKTKKAAKKRPTAAKKRRTRTIKRAVFVTAKKGESSMPKKRRHTKKRRRHNPGNPTPMRSRARRISKAIGAQFMGLNLKGAISSLPLHLAGMFSAKFAAKRLGGEESAASETDPESWTTASYVKGAVGGVVAGIAANMLRRGTGQKVVEGAFAYTAFKLVENELVTKSEWAQTWFGQDDYVPDEFGPMVTGTDTEPYMYGEDGNLMPADDRYRMLPEVMGALQPPGPLGDELQRPGAMGNVWARAYNLQD